MRSLRRSIIKAVRQLSEEEIEELTRRVVAASSGRAATKRAGVDGLNDVLVKGSLDQASFEALLEEVNARNEARKA